MADHLEQITNDDYTRLWKEFQAGNSQALDQIFNLNVISLYNYGRKITADGEAVKDCIQDLFVDLWKNKRNLIQPDSVKFYLLKSLRYKLLRSLKKENNKVSQNSLGQDYSYETVPSYESDIIARQLSDEQKTYLQKGLMRLSDRQREAIVLRFYEDMSHEEIAHIMSLKPQSVYNLIHKAITSLKNHLGSEVTFFSLLAGFLLTILSFLS